MTRQTALPLLAAAALGLAGCDWSTQADTSVPGYRHAVSVVEVVRQDGYDIAREFAGEVVAPQSPSVAFELPGRVSELLVDEGDRVIAGQELARLDLELLQAEERELAARTGEIEADLGLARRNLARIERLEAQSLASEREKDELASRVRALESGLARNQAALDANRIRQEQSVLLAPFNARIRERLVDEGGVVSAGAPVFRLAQLDQREVRAGLPQAVASTFAIGDPATLRSGNERATGRVVALGAEIDQGTRSQIVRVAIDRAWSPGELAYLEASERVASEGAWLPDSAVTGGLRGTWLVYVARPTGDGQSVLETRTVTIEHATEGRLFVSGALEDGELVVSGGLHRVAPGQIVRPETKKLLSQRS
ncbi:MAG: efflux RND transporter periplasmic adaptor subunit [Xanthomonadales bacterium]|jgi:RND family efflux transporter MFP subunit|nr:efflux RND transporter periplasmic adaptor subunit [Xanthomonadales bacterium]